MAASQISVRMVVIEYINTAKDRDKLSEAFNIIGSWKFRKIFLATK